MKLKAKLTAVTFAVLISLSAAGCNMADTTWVYDYSGDRIPAGVYLNYMLDAYAEASEKYSQENDESSPKPSDVLKWQMDGQPVDGWMLNRSREKAIQYYGLQSKYTALGLEVSSSDHAAVTSNLGSIWDVTSRFYEANGISNSSLESYLLENAKRQQLFTKLYGAGGEFEVPQQTLMDKFLEDYIKVEFMVVESLPFADDYDDPVAHTKSVADEFLNRLNAGENIEEVVYEYRTLISDNEGAAVSRPEEGELLSVIAKSDLQYYGELGDAINEAGTASYSQHVINDNIYILKHVSLSDDPRDLEIYRNSIINTLKYDEYLEKLTEWGEAVAPAANQAAISRYTPSKLKLDISKYASAS